jgi:RNA polymerase sigma-70 factor (ECF subfamily)
MQGELTMPNSQSIAGSAASRIRRCEAASDDDLIGAIARRDRDAMHVLFSRYNVRVFRFTMRLVGREAVAEELVGEVFLEVWRNAARFAARSSVSTWILGIARHKALSARERRACEPLDDTTNDSIADHSDDPEITMQNTERASILRDCLQRLSPAHREIIDLVYYHGQTIEEVARIVGVPPGTVKTRLHYARKLLAHFLAAHGIDAAAA